MHIHGVNLLEAAILGLDDEKKHDEYESRAAARKDQAVQVANFIRDKAGAIKSQ